MYAGLIAATAVVALTSVVHASPVAMASNMVGKPTFKSGGGAWKPLGVLQRLSPGDVVKCGPGQQAIIMMFTDGIRFKIASGSSGTIEPTSVRGGVSVGDMGGATIRVAKAMTGLDTQPFLARAVTEAQELVLHNNGIIVQGTKSITVNSPDSGVASYQLTLFNQSGNVLWSTRSDSPTIDLPADLPVATHKPYVWTLTEFGQSGKPQPVLRWGVATFLSQTDADQLTADAAAMESQAATGDDHVSPLLMESELYRQSGVYQGSLRVLSALKSAGQPGIPEAIADLCKQVSPYAGLLNDLHKSAASANSATAQNNL